MIPRNNYIWKNKWYEEITFNGNCRYWNYHLRLCTGSKKRGSNCYHSNPDVQCESCKKRIEEYLKREDGAQKSNVDFKKHVTKVTFVAERTNVENIKAAIANAGYDADDVKADEEAYKRLPKCCKKPADGGGM